MTIIFPMAGLSSRFTNAGYDKPKYMLDIDGNTVFFHAVNSFKNYFKDNNIVFIYRDTNDTRNFIETECKKMNIQSFQLIKLETETEGQAHTVSLGLEEAKIDKEESILIFNIDTFRPNFKLPSNIDFNKADGYLEVFEGVGDNWSFVLPEENLPQRVKRTTEKERISNLCSSGLYFFKKYEDFNKIFTNLFEKDIRIKNEFYIAPMYNDMIKLNKKIYYSKIKMEDIIFCGTPDEYKEILKEI